MMKKKKTCFTDRRNTPRETEGQGKNMISQKDKQIVRELAKTYMQYVNSDYHARGVKRMYGCNDLKPGRPPVVLEEIPWYQMDIDGELVCRCEGERERAVETELRRGIFYMKHFKADSFAEPYFRIKRTVHSTGLGVERPEYETRQTDDQNNIISRKLTDALEDESMLEKFRIPEFSLDPELDAQREAFVSELLGDTMPVKVYGYGGIYLDAWDEITFLRGMQAIYMDLYDRPEYTLAILQKFIDALNAELDFVEKNLEADPTVPSLHCVPILTSGLRAEDGLKGVWFRDNAQSLGSVSPAMFEEFAIDPIIQISGRFAYTYFGCCEPLDNKMDAVMKIPNIRKIGCSPWAKVEPMCERMGGGYVLARKPNPANVAIKTDPEVIRREIEETVKACLQYGTPYELVLKDISTVSNDPSNLIVWTQTVSDVLDQYYDKA